MLKFVYQAQPSLYVSKPPLVTGRQKTLAALGNNDTPALSVVIDHSQRWARPAASRIKQFLKNEPAQINARNALLSHLSRPVSCEGMQHECLSETDIERDQKGHQKCDGCYQEHRLP